MAFTPHIRYLQQTQIQYEDGLITVEEWRNKVISDLATLSADDLQEMFAKLLKDVQP